jgi:hypothetical protein
LSKVTEEREFLRSLNETLLSNQKEFNTQLAAAQAELKDKDAQLQDLQEQVSKGVECVETGAANEGMQRDQQQAGGIREVGTMCVGEHVLCVPMRVCVVGCAVGGALTIGCSGPLVAFMGGCNIYILLRHGWTGRNQGTLLALWLYACRYSI